MSLFSHPRSWSSRKILFVGLAALVVIFIIKIANHNTVEDTTADIAKPTVSLTTPATYAGQQSISLIGNVRSFSEANITAEQAGRVTAVRVKLGQTVATGQTIAILENASERAAVLQAEGIYEAALAASAQSDIGVTEAQTGLNTARNNAVSTFQSAYNTSNGIILNSIDTFFSNPNDRIPGLRIDGKGSTLTINSERVAYQTLLATWQNKAADISIDSDLESDLAYARQNVQRTIAFVDTFITIFNRQSGSSRYTDSELQAFITNFTGLRANLINLQTSLNNSLSSLDSAADAVQRAELNTSGSTASAADAQIKQALGTLRSAQANLAKTILRTPISGTINTLSVRTGDFISSFNSVAKVANNNSLEIITYVNETERELFTVGDPVLIEDTYTGTVTEIAPAVDSQTRKIEIRIATNELEIVNGDTVRITKESTTAVASDQAIVVPITAVKFAVDDGFIYTVDDNKLVANPVTLGVVRVDSVEITSGLSSDDEFVVDARGLLADTAVTITK